MKCHDHEQALRAVTVQRCGFGDDERGYCGIPASQHIWTVNYGGVANAYTMACDEHCAWFDTRRHLVWDHHPVTGDCAFPGAKWFTSHPDGGPGWCKVADFDWLSAVDAASRVETASACRMTVAERERVTVSTLARENWTPPRGKTWPEGAMEFTRDDAHRYLGIKPERLRQWVARGHVKKLGRGVDMGSILNYLHERQQRGELSE